MRGDEIRRQLEGDFENLERKVGEAEDIVNDMGGQYKWLKPYTDFDGPVRTRTAGEENYHEGIEEAFDLLIKDEDILNPGIISGRGTGYLLAQAEELGLSEIDIAGEMGAAYFPQDSFEGRNPKPYDAQFVVPEEEESMEDIYSFNLTLFEHLADHDLQLMYGDNMSNVTGSACIEASGLNLEEDRFSIEDTVYQDIYEHANAQSVQNQIETRIKDDKYGINNEDLFEFQNDMIRFEKSEDAAEIITDVFINNPFIPWAFHDDGDDIVITPQYYAKEDFTQDRFEDFVDSVTQDYNSNTDREFWTSTYHDHSFDFGKEGYENLKAQAAETIIEETGLSGPILPTNTGDKSTDIIPEGLFFAQAGTQAQDYCEENGISYVEVDNAVESFIIQSRLASRLDLEH